MKKFAQRLPILLALLALAFSGCGGSSEFGFDSNIKIFIQVLRGDAGQVNWSVSPNARSAQSFEAANTDQPQSWVTRYFVDFDQIDVEFTTNSSQTPYYFYLRRTPGTNPRVRVVIRVENIDRQDYIVDSLSTDYVKFNTIERNSVSDRAR